MDRSVQRLVRDYAVSHGEDRTWVDQLFDGGGSLPPLIRHAKGHATHIHVRFYNPLAQETGRRTYELLLDRKSTRLNSSHTVISYAVFCLKKKTYRMLPIREYNHSFQYQWIISNTMA